MKQLRFTKMQATGNDFVVIDKSVVSLPKLARKLCDRRFGIGADGLLLLEKSKKSDFRMRIFNPDGSEPEMCGNGLRCIAVFAHKNKIAPANMSIETKTGILNAKVTKDKVKINMAEPQSVKLGLDIGIDGKNYQVHYINTGVPHLVYYVDDLKNVDVYNLGRKMRYHPLFKPKGANANFISTTGKGALNIRTYERGVETETLACGTGAVASAIISSIIKAIKSPIKVYTRGGLLKIYFRKQNHKFKGVFLEGEAQVVFEGKIFN
ncbi:MAG: diaminopimelate epimerase [Candidatus Omnitrophota bacterium]|nr:MAG: diaminopimelate epimerase [Candidatus Omnitrophota bacterium]